jgi:antitoxin component of MazEF toxin-antitoxin module
MTDARRRTEDPLDIDVEGSGAVRIREPKDGPTLEELVQRITPKNCHSETDWGKPVGKELWWCEAVCRT